MKSKGGPDWRGWRTLTLWMMLCCGCMGVMLWWAAGKSIVIADTAPENGRCRRRRMRQWSATAL